MKKKTVIVGIIIAVILFGSILISTLGTKTNEKNNENNKTERGTASFRTKMLSMDSLDLSREEKLVLEYFDNSYTRLTSNIALVTQKYTNLFKNMKLYVEGDVLEIIESDDEIYKAIIKLYDDDYDILEDENHYCVIEGNQQLKRFQKGDHISAYGTFETSELTYYNNEKYTMPKLATDKWIENGANSVMTK